MKKYKKSEISRIMVDGEEFMITEDKKHLKGAKKKFTTEEFRKEKGEKVKFIVVPPQDIDERSAFGFTTEEKYEAWLSENNLHDHHQKDKEMDKWIRGKKSEKEDEEYIRQQNEKIEIATEKFEKFLKKHGLRSDDIDGIQDKIMELGPEHDQHSLYLYDGTWWSGRGIVIPGGHWWWFSFYPYCVPRLSSSPWLFDKMASSLATWGSSYARCYSGEWYSGIQVRVYCAIGDLNNTFGTVFGNIIRSVKVY